MKRKTKLCLKSKTNGRSLWKAFITEMMSLFSEAIKAFTFLATHHRDSSNLSGFVFAREHRKAEMRAKRKEIVRIAAIVWILQEKYCKFAQEIRKVGKIRARETFFSLPLDVEENSKFTLHFRYLARNIPQHQQKSEARKWIMKTNSRSRHKEWNWEISEIKTFFIGKCFRLFSCKCFGRESKNNSIRKMKHRKRLKLLRSFYILCTWAFLSYPTPSSNMLFPH